MVGFCFLSVFVHIMLCFVQSNQSVSAWFILLATIKHSQIWWFIQIESDSIWTIESLNYGHSLLFLSHFNSNWKNWLRQRCAFQLRALNYLLRTLFINSLYLIWHYYHFNNISFILFNLYVCSMWSTVRAVECKSKNNSFRSIGHIRSALRMRLGIWIIRSKRHEMRSSTWMGKRSTVLW